MIKLNELNAKNLMQEAKIKLMLFLKMLIAANTAAFSILLSFKLANIEYTYTESLGLFLAFRVFVFMANPAMPLNDKNVQFMSEQRTWWNLATIAIAALSIAIFAMI